MSYPFLEGLQMFVVSTRTEIHVLLSEFLYSVPFNAVTVSVDNQSLGD